MANLEDMREIHQELRLIIGDRDPEAVPLDEALWSNLEAKTGHSVEALKESFRDRMASALLEKFEKAIEQREARSSRQSMAIDAKETVMNPSARKPIRHVEIASYAEEKAQQVAKKKWWQFWRKD